MELECKMTMQQAKDEMEFFRKVFDVVRLVEKNELDEMEQVDVSGSEVR